MKEMKSKRNKVKRLVGVVCLLLMFIIGNIYPTYIFAQVGVRTFSWTAYTTNPSLCLYSIGLKYSNDFFILFSLYQRR